MSALRVMERHGVRLLPVMEETGRMLGLLSVEHILQGWTEDPLQPVAGVMAVCGLPGEEEEGGLEQEELLGAAELREWTWDVRWEQASGT